MKAPQLTVAALRIPFALKPACQAMLESILCATSFRSAMYGQQRAYGFIEALQLLEAIPDAEIERMHMLFEQALTARMAQLDT